MEKQVIEKHTKGDWQSYENVGRSQMVVRADNKNICVVGYSTAEHVFAAEQTREEAKANAELMASAPSLKLENEILKEFNAELLKALKPWIELNQALIRSGGIVTKAISDRLMEQSVVSREVISKLK